MSLCSFRRLVCLAAVARRVSDLRADMSADSPVQFPEQAGMPAKYGSSQKNCNTIEVTHGKEKGTDPFCAQHPAGRSGKRGLSPFPLRKMLKMLQFFSNGPYPPDQPSQEWEKPDQDYYFSSLPSVR